LLGDDDSSLMTVGAEKIRQPGQCALLEEKNAEARRWINAAYYKPQSWFC
jgi:hypothetical protein